VDVDAQDRGPVLRAAARAEEQNADHDDRPHDTDHR
jgi:hypothetical protein